jgi:hypothetical protein
MGQSSKVVNKGRATFDYVIFNGIPGANAIPFELASNRLDTKKLLEITDGAYKSTSIIANFRW